MKSLGLIDGPMPITFYPGCSLSTSAKESYQSLTEACEALGVTLTEVPDWNCCGSSSAHALDRRVSLELAARNLSLAPKDSPLMVACPSCLKNLAGARQHLEEHPDTRARLEDRWGRSLQDLPEVASFLELLHFIEVMSGILPGTEKGKERPLAGMKIAPYYGCMLYMPKALKRAPDCQNMMERELTSLGAEVLNWECKHRCCGTFLAASKPEVAAPLIDKIMSAALAAGADCVVTACAMCQLNLEIRCSVNRKLPTLHFTEVLALALGQPAQDAWFTRHLVDPRPLLQKQGLI